MSEEKIATDGIAQTTPSADPIVNDATPAPKEEESIDEKVKEILGDIPTVEETEKPEEKPATTPPEKQGEVLEKKIEEPVVEKQPDAPQVLQPSRLERRIAKLYQEVLILKGNDEDLDPDQILSEIKKYSLADKTKALRNLISERNTLRTGKKDDTVDLSEEDHQAIVEAEVENRLQGMQAEIQEREWKDDLVKSVEAHPELDERRNEYNPKIAVAVEKLAQKGMKVSEAYQLVTESISSAQADEKKEAEIKKQKALSGAVSATHDNVEPKGGLTWEDMARIQVEDPDRYMKIIKDGKLPEN